MSANGGKRAVLAALFANMGIAVAKLVAFIFTGASSMWAEAIHSAADSGNQALLLLGGKLSRREASDRHPFGYGRERYFWSFIVALVIFAIGATFAIYEGISKIRHPHEIDAPIWAFSVLSLGIVLESFSFRLAIVESRLIKGNSSWYRFIRQSRTPELPVVLLEDLGALLGLVIALVALGIAVIWEAPVWDGIGTLSIGIVLAAIAVALAAEMKSLLIGEGLTRRDSESAIRAVEKTTGVKRLIHIRTQYLGPDEVLIGLKVEFNQDLPFKELRTVIDEVEHNIKSVVPAAGPIYVEPGLATQE